MRLRHAGDPIARFRRWYAQAYRGGNARADACALATADRRGRPSARFVLLKGADRRGFHFYTHRGSRKGRELSGNPHASLAFYWHATHHQVRVDGRVALLSRAEADAYWAGRPREAQLGALASRQSAPLRSRRALLSRVRELRVRYRGREIPRPRTWAGYRLVPRAIEFWTRGEHRLHHRVLYRRTVRGWGATLLQP